MSVADETETEDFVGSKIVLSKLFVLVQESDGVTKRRVLLDCKKSEVSASSTQPERVKLPRAVDVITDVIELLGNGRCQAFSLSHRSLG